MFLFRSEDRARRSRAKESNSMRSIKKATVTLVIAAVTVMGGTAMTVVTADAAHAENICC